MLLKKVSTSFVIITILCLFGTDVLGENPFRGKPLYVNPLYRKIVFNRIRAAKPADRNRFVKVLNVPTALWLTTKASVDSRKLKSSKTFLGVLNHAVSKRPVPLITSVIYNLPNRDCAATASNGKICCLKKPDGSCDYTVRNCDAGLQQYRKSFIDKISKLTKNFCRTVPMVFIIEPDALPNVATNLENPKCRSNSTRSAYKHGIRYAVRSLARACPSASLYLDAANGAWLGWKPNAERYVSLVKSLGIVQFLKGFALNVANYQPLGIRCPVIDFCTGGKNVWHPCCRQDSCNLIKQWNSGHTELNYVDVLKSSVNRIIPGFSPTFVIDTARNGIPDARKDCSNWCNIRRAGIGTKPTLKTAHALVDAYLWIKVPTESDGCTRRLPNGPICPRYDPKCASVDSIGSNSKEPRAPAAGRNFKFLFQSLVLNGDG